MLGIPKVSPLPIVRDGDLMPARRHHEMLLPGARHLLIRDSIPGWQRRSRSKGDLWPPQAGSGTMRRPLSHSRKRHVPHSAALTNGQRGALSFTALSAMALTVPIRNG